MTLLFDILFYISLATALLGSLYGLKLAARMPFSYLVLLLWASVIGDIIGDISQYYYLQRNVDLGIRGVGATYRIIEFTLLLLFFRHLEYSKIVKNAITLSGFIFIIYFISIQPAFFRIFVDSTMVEAVSIILVVVFSLLFFKSTMTRMEISTISKWPPFYFISAFFIYFSGASMSMLLSNSVYSIDIDMGNHLWNFNNFSLIIRNILLIIGFFYTYKTKYKWSPISIH
ncbi:hypothetical protein [Fulvivirga sp.]|uniref:hypothetical protein n=1 Tax=Fulvivirga sp. TaxID=1931237 RepID=UPI0032ED3129